MMWIQKWKTFNYVWSLCIISEKGKPIHRRTVSFVNSLSTLFSIHFSRLILCDITNLDLVAQRSTWVFFVASSSVENACTSAMLISSIWLRVHLCCFKFVFCPKANFSFGMSCSCYLFVSSLLALHACLFVLQLSVYIVWGKSAFIFPQNNVRKCHFNKTFIADHFLKISTVLTTHTNGLFTPRVTSVTTANGIKTVMHIDPCKYQYLQHHLANTGHQKTKKSVRLSQKYKRFWRLSKKKKLPFWLFSKVL